MFQIDDLLCNICKVLTKIINCIDAKGKSFIRDTYHFKEMLQEMEWNKQEWCQVASFNIFSLDIKKNHWLWYLWKIWRIISRVFWSFFGLWIGQFSAFSCRFWHSNIQNWTIYLPFWMYNSVTTTQFLNHITLHMCLQSNAVLLNFYIAPCLLVCLDMV